MSKIKSIEPSSISRGELFGYLLSAVAPRPIAFASTVDLNGNVNLSPFSFFNVFSSNPPVMIFSPARRGRDNTTKHTYDNVKAVNEVVINIVNHPIVEQMSLSSTEYGDGVNEFVKAGLTQVKSDKIKPPRVGEAPVAFECVVDQVIELGDGPGAGNLVIARVVMIHIQEQYLNEEGKLDTTKLDLVARMGGSWYCRANGNALFEIPKPLQTKGMGVDQLPEGIRNSEVLTGNNLGRLGNVEQFPSASTLDAAKEETRIKNILTSHGGQSNECKKALHQLAKEMITAGDTAMAMNALLIAEEIKI